MRLLAIIAIIFTFSAEAESPPSIASDEPLELGRWHGFSFDSPMDHQLWQSASYISNISTQSIRRYSGILVRCTNADLQRKLIVMFAFGAVLKTKVTGEIQVKVRFDHQRRESLTLFTRNQANAEYVGAGAVNFLRQMLHGSELKVSAKLSPKGRSELTIPLQRAGSVIREMLDGCDSELRAQVVAENPQQLASQPTVDSNIPADPLQKTLYAY